MGCEEWRYKMMFVSDIFWELNYLNAILQGKGLFANEI